MNDGDYQLYNAVLSRRKLARFLFLNKDDLALFNHQEDKGISWWIDNLESVRLLSIRDLNSGCLPLYEARVHFKFVDPRFGIIPEEGKLSFVVLNEEIEGLGWRIEELNTAPGVSDYLCPP